MRLPFVLLLALIPTPLLAAEPRRLGDDGFRIEQAFTHAVLSPDGRFFAVAGQRGGFAVLDAGTGRVVQAWDGGAAVLDLAFDAAGRLQVFSADGWVRTYDRTGRRLREVLLAGERSEAIQRGWFVAGGLVCAYRRADCALVHHDANTGQPLPWPGDLNSHQTAVGSDDGAFLAVVTSFPEEKLELLDRCRGQVAWSDAGKHPNYHGPAFRPGGRELLVLTSSDALLFDLASGRARRLPLDGWPEHGYRDPVWSPDGRRLALRRTVVELPTAVREWDVATGRLLHEEVDRGGGRDRTGYTPDGRLLWWNSSGRRLDVREVGRPKPPPRCWGHGAELRDLAFDSADTLVTLDCDGVLCRWDVATGTQRSRSSVPKALGNRRLDAAGRTVLMESRWRFVRFDVANEKLGPDREAPAEPDAVSPDGRWFLDWDEKRGRLYDSERGRTTWLAEDGDLWLAPRDCKPQAAWSPDGRWLALCLRRPAAQPDADDSLEVAVVKLPTGRLARRFVVAGCDRAPEPLFTADGLLLIPGTGGVDAYEATTGRLRRRYAAPEGRQLYPLACSPDGRLLLAVAGPEEEGPAVFEPWRFELLVIELATGSVRRRHPCPAGSLFHRALRFSPDGRRLALPLSDGTVLVLSTDSPLSPPIDDAALWRDLASPDAAVAGAAILAATRRPDAAAWLQARLDEPSRPGEPEWSAATWLAELDHDDPARREAARQRLVSRPDVLADLEATRTEGASPEVRRGLAEVRDAQALPTPATLREARLREALGRVSGGP